MTIKTLHDAPTDDELHAYVDGRLDPARRAVVAAWLEVLRSHAADPTNSFSDEALLKERTQMERQLRAALRSEEMKKFIKGPFEFLL